MRPTPEGVGNALDAFGYLAGLDASMRPTPEGVGNQACRRGAIGWMGRLQ